MRKPLVICGLIAALAVGGCSNMSHQQQRVLSGAGLGAAGGAVIGGLAGGSALTGALLGGAGGAAVGALMR